MTIHRLHLHPEPFHLIATGKKTVESRLFDEKRQLIQVGDQLVFTNRANEAESISTIVTALHRASSFGELFADDSVKGKFSTDSLDVLLEGVGKYYTEEHEARYGVVGLEFAMINPMTDHTDIHKAAGIILKDRHILVTRSAGKDIFIAPGGKLEAGETVVEALAREMMEEVNITIDTSTLEELGIFYAEAAGNRQRSLRMDTYIIHDYEGELIPSSEVEELRWITTQTTDIEVGSVIEHDVMPLLKQRDLID